MTTKVISYKSDKKTVNTGTNLLETSEKDWIKCEWNGYVDTSYYTANFTWKFDWGGLESEGVDRLVGHLIVKSVQGYWSPHKIDIDWTDTNQSVSATVGNNRSTYAVTFEYNLTAHYAELPPPKKVSYDDMFAASDKTDVVLIVEGKKLNVSKAFLSFHSDYFTTLFSANFKEGHERNRNQRSFPNDSTVEKLLETASRFQVSSVIGIVEYHLLHNSRIGYERMLWLADEYVMPTLLEKCIRQMNSLEKAKKLEKSPEFEKLSVNTRSLILGRLLRAL
ncbi:unnamed protein product [Caenorhabditis nigoni]